MLEVIGSLLDGPGVLVTGPLGSGKRTFVTGVMRRLQGIALVIDLGFLEGNGAALGLNRILESCQELDDAERFKSWVAAHTLLEEEAMGRPIVVFVPEALQLGAHAVALLASLAMANTISLLCLATTVASAGPQSRDDLAAAVRLRHLQLQPLDLQDAHQVLAKVLGGGVSLRAAHQLWSTSGGQLHVLRELVLDWQEQGYLLERNGNWVVGGAHGPVGPRCRSLVAEVLKELTSPEREVVEFLALAQVIRLGSLMALCDADAVDAVHTMGLVAGCGRFSGQVRLSSTFQSRIVRELTPPGHARALLERYRNLPAAGPRLPALVELAWEQRAGLVSAPELVRTAVREAIDQGEAALGIGILHNAGATDTEAELLHLEALQLAGYLEQAGAVLQSLRLRMGRGPSPVGRDQNAATDPTLVRLEMTAIRQDSLKLGGTWEVIDSRIRRIREALGARDQAAPEAAQVLQQLAGGLDLLEAEIRYRLGLLPGNGDYPYNHPRLEGHELLRWQFIHNRQSIRAGRIQIGLKRGLELVMLEQQEYLASDTIHRAKLEMADLLLSAGEWNQAVNLLDSGWLGGEESPRLTEIIGLYSTLAQLFEGDSVTASNQSGTEIEQLRVYDPLGHLPLAVAAAALNAVRMGTNEADLLLTELEAIPASPDWEIAQAVSLIVSISQHELGDSEGARKRLGENANFYAARKIVNLELSNRLIMDRFGNEEGIEELIACARKVDGSISDTVLGLAAGAGMSNNAGLARTVAEAWESGANLHRTGKVPKARNPQVEPGDSGGRGLDPTDSEARVSVQMRNSALAVVSSLTKRQRTIVAEAATGASSREIAQRLDIKVRTVEGHLYQIYQRINVGSRDELRQLYALAQAAAEANGAAVRSGT